MRNSASHLDRSHSRRSGSARRSGFGKAVQWIDAWTVEAFNPVFPHRRSPRS